MMSTDTRRALLIVDDDGTFREVLARALRRRGFEALTAASVDAAQELPPDTPLCGAIVDLKMPGPSGLVLIQWLRRRYASMPILMLTGFASIATAVEAVKLGATQYLAKPVDADQVLGALFGEPADVTSDVPTQRLSVDRLEWEHIQAVLADQGGNISATARALNMHRRTLQRKLGKKPVSQ